MKTKLKIIVNLTIFLLLAYVVLILLGSISTPIITALILAYIFNPIANYLKKIIHLNRTVTAAILSILLFIAIVGLPIIIVPFLVNQLRIISTEIPKIIDFLNLNLFNAINIHYHTNFVLDSNAITAILKNLASYLYKNTDIVTIIINKWTLLFKVIFYIILIPLTMFSIISNWETVLLFLNQIIPKRYKQITIDVFLDLNHLLSAYLRGQITVMIIMMLYYIIALNIISLTSATLVGAITGFLVFIPYIGVILGFLISIMLTATTSVSIGHFIAILIVFAIGHASEGLFITPFFVGKKIGLSPIVVIFCLITFATIFGFLGILLSLPLATVAVVLFKYVKQYYLNSDFYNN